MKTAFSAAPLAEQKKDALILFFHGTEPVLPAGDQTFAKQIANLTAHTAFKGEAGQVAIFPTLGQLPARQLIFSGLGETRHFHPGVLEQAAAAAVKAGLAARLTTFSIALSAQPEGIAEADFQLLVGRGAAWGSYAFTAYKSDDQKRSAPTLTFAGATRQRQPAKTAEIHGQALCETADLANLPGNEATPVRIADWAKAMAKRTGLTCEVMDKTALQKKGCGGILAVGQGSANDPRMIILRHAGTEKSARPIVLVGKTITFDSGGISLKPGKGMGWMRYDKCGGMAVLAAMQMVARMGVNAPVIGILGAAENMPGSRATRPGDIIKAYGGKSIEVLNTDAEGRLVLADALGLAVDLKPRAIVDLATLTGAVIVALGSAAAAVLGNDQRLIDQLVDAGKAAGERLWQLPLFKEYADDMKSDFADLSNLSKSGGAGTATAAAFLNAFVPEEIPWAHLDIAGTAWLESAKPHQAPGATLFGARLLAQWIAAQN